MESYKEVIMNFNILFIREKENQLRGEARSTHPSRGGAGIGMQGNG